MDPDVALEEMRALQRQVQEEKSAGKEPPRWMLEEIAEYADALDQWLTKGGYKPAAWH